MEKEKILEQIALCVEFGKINYNSPYPPSMKGENGVDELTREALETGVAPSDILAKGLIVGMEKIGVKFRNNQVFVPQVLMSTKAMSVATQYLKEYFNDGTVVRKGKFIMGTVEGDLHDIGKNLVCMMVEGNGYEIIDLGVDVSPNKFVDAIKKHPDASYVGMSALLTTTMKSMEKTNVTIKSEFPNILTFIGGAPVSRGFAKEIGADYYAEEPQGLVEILNDLIANRS
jgi:5-methyltetrahydrofolate--homocysteine methyltransferase